MRPIKFRLRNRQNQIVGYEKWYEGHWLIDEHRYDAYPRCLYCKANKNWTPDFIPHDFKEQFTGLLDKNGKEIYDGDIVLYSKSRDYQGYKGIIGFFEGGFRIYNSLKEQYPRDIEIQTAFDRLQLEVIGNIHDNPELLKSKGRE